MAKYDHKSISLRCVLHKNCVILILQEEEAARSSPRKRKSIIPTATPAKTPAKTPRKSSTKTPLRVLPTPSYDEPEDVPKQRAIKPKVVRGIIRLLLI